jgi:hypothetical protein
MRIPTSPLLAALALASLLGVSGCVHNEDPPAQEPEPIIVLPPDPGTAGKATVQGIDSDTDGRRDDVQIFVDTTYLDTASRAATSRLAKAFQAFLIQGSDKAGALAAAASLNKAIDCLYALDPENFGDLVDEVEAKVVNTNDRSKAYAKAGAFISGGTFPVSTVADNAASCRETP